MYIRQSLMDLQLAYRKANVIENLYDDSRKECVDIIKKVIKEFNIELDLECIIGTTALDRTEDVDISKVYVNDNDELIICVINDDGYSYELSLCQFTFTDIVVYYEIVNELMKILEDKLK